MVLGLCVCVADVTFGFRYAWLDRRGDSQKHQLMPMVLFCHWILSIDLLAQALEVDERWIKTFGYLGRLTARVQRTTTSARAPSRQQWVLDHLTRPC
jgi:hypothetical protein